MDGAVSPCVLTPVSRCKDICVRKTKTSQFSVHNKSQEATQVNLKDLELSSLVMLTIKFNVITHPAAMPKHDINM